MQDDKERADILASVLVALEAEYAMLKSELQYEEKMNRYLHDQAKKQRNGMFLSKITPDLKNKNYLLGAIKANDQRIKQLETAKIEKKQLQSTLEVVTRKVSKSIPSKLETVIEKISDNREKTHSRLAQMESQRNRSLQKVKKAITEQQALSVMNSTLTSFKSVSSLSLSTASKSSASTVQTKKTKVKVTSKSKKREISEEKPDEQQFDFKKKENPAYPRLKLFQYDPLPKTS